MKENKIKVKLLTDKFKRKFFLITLYNKYNYKQYNNSHKIIRDTLFGVCTIIIRYKLIEHHLLPYFECFFQVTIVSTTAFINSSAV